LQQSYLEILLSRIVAPTLTVWLVACSSSSPSTTLGADGATPMETGGSPSSTGGTAEGGTGAGGSGEGGTVMGGGGATSAGGDTGALGGATSAGGASGTGGRRGTGGARASGGSTTSAGGGATAGGAVGSGGAVATGGVVATGGATFSAASIQLVGNKILDVAGNPIVARGPEDVMASEDQTKDIDLAAGFGANAMRMLLTLDAANGMTPASFDLLLSRAVSRHMLVWIALFTWDVDNSYVIGNALGGGNFYSLPSPAGAACSKDTPASCYLAVWSRQWLKDLMNKYRSNVIIDAMQEFINPGDPSTESERVAWATAAKANIQFFRAQGYTNPLEIGGNYEGRDLYGIVEYGPSIRAVDTVLVGSDPQTMFDWQAYWGTSDNYYPKYQGPLLTGQSGAVVTGAQAIHDYAATQPFPIQIGIDNYAGDTNKDYQAEIDQAAADNMSWLWWSWKTNTVECPVSGAACATYVTTAQNGFKGAKPLTN
jgi:hypothetical protein